MHYYCTSLTYMGLITKEDILSAFKEKKRKRNFLLYEYYHDFFNDSYTSETIAKKISEDLGLPISKSIIEMVRFRIVNKIKKETSSSTPPLVQSLTSLKSEIKHTNSTKQPVLESALKSTSPEIVQNLPSKENHPARIRNLTF